MTAALFLYGVGFSLVPWWLATALLVVWAALLALVIRWFSTRPRTTVAVPVLAVLLWYGAVVGWRVLG